MEDYKLISQFCRQHGRHGGSAIYCRKSLNAFERTDYVKLSEVNVVECSAIQINLSESSLVIVCIYRPNSKPLADMDIFLEKFNSILIKCRSENCKFIIAGNFNIDVLSYSRDSREFLSLIEMFNVSLRFTSITRPVSGSCLDNM